MNNDNKLTLEELHTLKELLANLDEKGEVFKLSSTMIDINEKVKTKNLEKGDKK